ncbi:MAG: VacJ family lipoprotein [Rhodospirillales bacterium]|nr:VacJ family lipoprotein [Rhodospirillales bacterium]
MKRAGHAERLIASVMIVSLLAGCATPVPFREGNPPLPEREPATTVEELVTVYDPLEGLNREIYAFNYEFDRLVFLPVVGVYETVLAQPLRDRIHDFLGNLRDIVTFANLVLQARPVRALQTAFRIGVNTGLGFFGIVDIASAVGMRRESEDFGQTLGYWGVTDGPYLVLPVLGPANLRDTTGYVVDSLALDPLGLLANLHTGLAPYAWARTSVNAVDTRANTPFRYYGTGSPFEYDYVRLLYTRKRELDIIR